MTTITSATPGSQPPRWLKHRLQAMAEALSPARLAATGRQMLLPIIGILLFVGFWHLAAPQVDTSLGSFPGPAQVWEQSGQLWQEHANQRERADKFIAMQEERNARILADNPDAEVRIRPYPERRPSSTRSGPVCSRCWRDSCWRRLLRCPWGSWWA